MNDIQWYRSQLRTSGGRLFDHMWAAEPYEYGDIELWFEAEFIGLGGEMTTLYIEEASSIGQTQKSTVICQNSEAARVHAERMYKAWRERMDWYFSDRNPLRGHELSRSGYWIDGTAWRTAAA